MSKVPPINLFLLQKLTHSLQINGVSYGLGSKVKLEAPAKSIQRIDCSGLVRWLVYNCTSPHLVIPDGSYNQREWCQKMGLVSVPYNQVNQAPNLAGNDLFIAFINKTSDHEGHVWFVNDGETFESHHGRGVNSRKWNSRPLPQEVAYCFIWPHIWKPGL
jgi:hypothetical protein